MATDYSSVTELPGIHASQEQLAMLYHRYRTAKSYCEGKDVLEVGCGGGLGLGYLAKGARFIVGGDYTEDNLRSARQHYQGKAKLVCFDAHQLPFRDKSFHVLILFEAIYYLISPDRFLEESLRLLRENSLLLICTVNKDWSDFNPSPFSVKYFSASELVALLRRRHFEVELFGAFPTSMNSMRGRLVSWIKRAAVALHLIPKTMRGKELLKRIFFGKLSSIPAEIEEGMTEYAPLAPISTESPNSQFKVLYAVARNCRS